MSRQSLGQQHRVFVCRDMNQGEKLLLAMHSQRRSSQSSLVC